MFVGCVKLKVPVQRDMEAGSQSASEHSEFFKNSHKFPKILNIKMFKKHWKTAIFHKLRFLIFKKILKFQAISVLVSIRVG